MKLTIPGFSVEINEKDYEALEKVANSDLIGLIGGDWLKYWRWNNLLKIVNKFRLKCEAEGFTPRKVAPKFLYQFFEVASREDDEILQELWANLLYSESKNSGSISLKSMQILKYMTGEDAKLLNKMFQYVFQFDSNSIMMCASDDYKDKFKIEGSDLLRLNELGILSFIPFLSYEFKIDNGIRSFWTNNYEIKVKYIGKEERGLSVPISIYMFTRGGFEIFNIENHIDNFESVQYMIDYFRSFGLEVTIYNKDSSNERVL